MIRPASPTDAEQISAIYAPIVRDTYISFEYEAPPAGEFVGRIEKSHEWLVAERRDGIVGYAYAGPFHARAAYRWSVEVSIYLAPDARGEGIGRELLGELLRRLSRRGFVNAFAGVALPNPASVALFESFGFDKIAHQRNVGFKLGRWHDVGWWQLQLCVPTVPPPDTV